MTERLPAQLEVAALVRATQAEGGFAAILAKGDPDSGTILVVLMDGGRDQRCYDRPPMIDGTRTWRCAQREELGHPQAFADYLGRRRKQDPDLWIVELDIANGERLIGLS